jgi:hypothetical protein
MIQGARQQAARYSSGVLWGFELREYRYLIMVSEKQLQVSDIQEADVTYRIINIAVDPSTPSAQRHQ